MARKVEVEVTVPEGLQAGDTFTLEVEIPRAVRRTGPFERRGQLAGLQLTEMSDDQLKREIINAKSVLYKAQKRGSNQEIIEANQKRVDAALEERDRRAIEKDAQALEEASNMTLAEADAEVNVEDEKESMCQEPLGQVDF